MVDSGKIFLGNGRLKQAKMHFEMALEMLRSRLNPLLKATTHYYLALTLRELGSYTLVQSQLQQARTGFDAIHNETENEGTAYCLLEEGCLFLDLQDFPLAINLGVKALEQFSRLPNSGEGQFLCNILLGSAFSVQKAHTVACKYYLDTEKLLDDRQGFDHALLNLRKAQYFFSRNAIEDAEGLCASALQIFTVLFSDPSHDHAIDPHPRHIEALFLFGKILISQKNWVEANRVLNQALSFASFVYKKHPIAQEIEAQLGLIKPYLASVRV